MAGGGGAHRRGGSAGRRVPSSSAAAAATTQVQLDACLPQRRQHCRDLVIVTAAVLMCAILGLGTAYRIHNPEITPLPETPPYFPPYVDGFTGRASAPTNPGRIRVNEGSQFTKTQPNIFEGVKPRRNVLFGEERGGGKPSCCKQAPDTQ